MLVFVFEFFSGIEDEVKHSICSLEGLTQVVNHLLVLLLFLGLTQKAKKSNIDTYLYVLVRKKNFYIFLMLFFI